MRRAGTGTDMWMILAVLILAALVVCSMPLPAAPRHRADPVIDQGKPVDS